jgi:hypothetical protein
MYAYRFSDGVVPMDSLDGIGDLHGDEPFEFYVRYRFPEYIEEQPNRLYIKVILCRTINCFEWIKRNLSRLIHHMILPGRDSVLCCRGWLTKIGNVESIGE